MADLVERIVEINRRVWDEWPVGIDAGNVEEVRRAAAIAVAVALEAEASEGGRLREALKSALALIDDYLAYRHDGDPWSEDARLISEMEINDAVKDGRLDAIRAALIPEAPVRDGWMPIETAPKDWSDVLLFVPDLQSDHRTVCEGFYDAEEKSWRSPSFREVAPTHWRPLPAPPQDNREG